LAGNDGWIKILWFRSIDEYQVDVSGSGVAGREQGYRSEDEKEKSEVSGEGGTGRIPRQKPRTKNQEPRTRGA